MTRVFDIGVVAATALLVSGRAGPVYAQTPNINLNRHERPLRDLVRRVPIQVGRIVGTLAEEEYP